MNNVRGRTQFVDSTFPKARSVSAPPVQVHDTDELKLDRNQNAEPVSMPSYSAIRQLAVSTFYLQKLKTDASFVIDVLAEHITLLGESKEAEPSDGQQAETLINDLNQFMEDILSVYPAEARHNHVISSVAQSCMRKFDQICERVLQNVVRWAESPDQENSTHLLNDQKSQYVLLKSLASALSVDGHVQQAAKAQVKHQDEQQRADVMEVGTQSRTEMTSQEVQATSDRRESQVQTDSQIDSQTELASKKLAHASVQTVVKMRSKMTQAQPNVRTSQMQTDAHSLVDKGVQFSIVCGEFASQTTETASALTRSEWEQMRQTFATMPDLLGNKIAALLDRKKSAAITIDKAQRLVAPYSAAFDQLEQYLSAQVSPTQDMKQVQNQVIAQLCDSLLLLERYRAMTFAAIFPIVEGDRHNGLQALAKELEQLRYQRAATVLKLLQRQKQGTEPDASLARLLAMKPDGAPWAIYHRDKFNHILDQLHENIEDYILALDGKLTNYECESTEESIVHATVDKFLPLVAQIKITASEAGANTREKSDQDFYKQYLIRCDGNLAHLLKSLGSKLKGTNKEQDARMLIALNEIIKPVSEQIKKVETSALPSVSSVDSSASPKSSKAHDSLQEYMLSKQDANKWKEEDLAFLNRILLKVREDIYTVEFYQRQSLNDSMWEHFQPALLLERGVKASHKSLVTRKKKNNALMKAHEFILNEFSKTFDAALGAYPERAEEISALRQ